MDTGVHHQPDAGLKTHYGYATLASWAAYQIDTSHRMWAMVRRQAELLNSLGDDPCFGSDGC